MKETIVEIIPNGIGSRSLKVTHLVESLGWGRIRTNIYALQVGHKKDWNTKNFDNKPPYCLLRKHFLQGTTSRKLLLYMYHHVNLKPNFISLLRKYWNSTLLTTCSSMLILKIGLDWSCWSGIIAKDCTHNCTVGNFLRTRRSLPSQVSEFHSHKHGPFQVKIRFFFKCIKFLQ